MVEQVVVGIDVSKAKLDVALLPGGEQFTVSNDRHGIGELLRRVSPLAPSRVVLEATGKLEQLAVSERAPRANQKSIKAMLRFVRRQVEQVEKQIEHRIRHYPCGRPSANCWSPCLRSAR